MTTATLTLKPVHMKSGDTKLALASPYHPRIPAAAKALGGRWGAEKACWYFDPRDVERVRAMCVDIYGFDPMAEAPADLVTVQVRPYELGEPRADTDEMLVFADNTWFAGRQILRYGKPGDGCAIVAGEIIHGGSRKHTYSQPSDDLVVEVRDVPRALVDREREQQAQRLSKVVDTLHRWMAKRSLIGHGFNEQTWTALSDEERERIFGRKTAEWKDRLDVMNRRLDAIKIVKTLDPVAVVHEVAAAQPAREPEPGSESPTERIWAEIQQLSPQERAALLGRLLADS